MDFCLKDKDMTKCKTEKCSTYRKYQSAGCTQCPYYIPEVEQKGYDGELEDICGKRIYRMWSNIILYFYIFIILFTTVSISYFDLFSERNFYTKDYVDLLQTYLIFGVFFISLWLFFLLINLTIIKPLVAVINKQGFYLNEKMISLDEIDTLQYETGMPGRSGYDCCKLIICTKDNEEYILPHAPRNLQYLIKKHNPNIKIKHDKWFWFFVIMILVVILIIPFLSEK